MSQAVTVKIARTVTVTMPVVIQFDESGGLCGGGHLRIDKYLSTNQTRTLLALLNGLEAEGRVPYNSHRIRALETLLDDIHAEMLKAATPEPEPKAKPAKPARP